MFVLIIYSSPLISSLDYFSLAIGGIGIVISFLFFFLSRKKKIPVYRCRTTRLITSSINQIDELDILYDKKKLNALSITKVALWNAGRDTISWSDVSELDRLRISIGSDYEILSCVILKQTRIANNFSVQIADDKKSIYISFDYFDHNEGVVLKIRHTGSSSSEISVNGSIKAVQKIKRGDETMNITLNSSKKYQSMRKNRWWFLLLGIVLFAFAFLLIVCSNWIVEQRFGFYGKVFGRTSIFVLMLFLMYYSTLFVSRFSLFSKNPIPASLFNDYVNEDF